MPDSKGKRIGLVASMLAEAEAQPPVGAEAVAGAAPAAPGGAPPKGPRKGRLIQFNPEEDAQKPLATALATPPRATAFAVEDGHRKAKQEMKEKLWGGASAEAAAGDDDGSGNIVGFAIGEKNAEDGRPTGDMAVKVLVARKLAMGLVPQAERIPVMWNGMPTDVVQVGQIQAQSLFGFQDREKPAKCGASVGHVDVTAGTIGCLVVTSSGDLCILSNNHILANVNAGKAGDRIVQPGPADGGTILIGKLLAGYPKIDFSGDNEVDAALALTNFDVASPSHHSFTIDTTVQEPSLNLHVRKEGRTTGLTSGIITGLDADIRCGYSQGRTAQFVGTIKIQGIGDVFSQGGDSGSLIVTDSFQPVGLLFCGSTDGFTFAIPITKVLEALDCDFVNSVDD